MPRPGEKVTIQATHPRVQAGSTAFGIFLADAPVEVTWSSWWWERERRGDIRRIEPVAAPIVAPITPPPSE